MGFFDFFSNNAETAEQHQVVGMRSRYYKSGYKKVKEQIESYCNKNQITIKHVDDVHNEMFLQTNKFHMIVSIVQVSPLETSVDMKVQTYKIMGMNAPKNLIMTVYKYLDSNLTFKGTGLHP